MLQDWTLILLSACGVEWHALMLNISSHFTGHIARYFCETKANSLSQKIVATIIQYDTFRPRLVTYRENLPINLLYTSRSEWARYDTGKKTHCKFYKTFPITKRSRKRGFLPKLNPRSTKGVPFSYPVFLFFSWNYRGKEKIGRNKIELFSVFCTNSDWWFTEKNKKISLA